MDTGRRRNRGKRWIKKTQCGYRKRKGICVEQRHGGIGCAGGPALEYRAIIPPNLKEVTEVALFCICCVCEARNQYILHGYIRAAAISAQCLQAYMPSSPRGIHAQQAFPNDMLHLKCPELFCFFLVFFYYYYFFCKHTSAKLLSLLPNAPQRQGAISKALVGMWLGFAAQDAHACPLAPELTPRPKRVRVSKRMQLRPPPSARHLLHVWGRKISEDKGSQRMKMNLTGLNSPTY